jgi:hypothetical protein
MDGRRQLNTERDRDILRVDEDIEQDIALVRHDGHLGRASVLAQICDELVRCTLCPTQAGIGVQLMETAARANEIHEQ